MDIQEATSIIKCIPAIYRHRGYYDKDGKWFEGEGNLLTEKEIIALETILSELDYKDKENTILRQGLKENTEEIDKLNKIIDLMAEELADWHMDNKISNREIDKQYVINKFANKVKEDK